MLSTLPPGQLKSEERRKENRIQMQQLAKGEMRKQIKKKKKKKKETERETIKEKMRNIQNYHLTSDFIA